MGALCLNMIVKNEERIITRLLDSVQGVVSEYVILDTGSTDSTVELIQNYPIPGHVLREPFRDFGASRTRAMEIARELSRATHLLLLDADMVLCSSPSLPENLDTDTVYSMTQKNGNLSYHNVRIVPRLADVKCVGYTHEYYSFPNAQQHLPEDVAYIRDVGDGGSKADKFERDERLLKMQLEKNPGDPRTLFYLGQTTHCLGRFEEAVGFYEARLRAGDGFQEETNYCKYRLTTCFLALGRLAEAEAWAQQPEAGPEAAHRVTVYLREKQGDPHRAVYYCLMGLQRVRSPQPFLFVEEDVRSFLLERELTILWYYVRPDPADDYGLRASWRFLQKQELPKWAFDNVYTNLLFYALPLSGGSTTTLLVDTEPGWACSTPTTTGKDDFLVRVVNYRVCPETGSYLPPSGGGPIDTYYVDFAEKKRLSVDPARLDKSTLHLPNVSVRGVEDLRVSGERVLGVSREFVAEGQEVSVVLGSLKDHTLTLLCAVKTDRSVEKNWVWTGLEDGSFVYDWFPSVTVAVVRKDAAEVVREIPSPPSFRVMRGSSCGAVYGEEVWFVTHSIIPNPSRPRVYLHYLVVFDRRVSVLKRVSAPFTFEEPPSTEYCNGLFVDGDGLRIAYSRLDRTSRVLRLPWDRLPPFHSC